VNSRTTRTFWKLHDALPAEVRRGAARVYRLWRMNPEHPSLRFKCVSEPHRAYSIRIGLNWRALGYRDGRGGDDTITWFWIGSHADYDRLIASI
jgi:hypothetical protein